MSPTNEPNTMPTSPKRRSCLTALLAAPLGSGLAACGGGSNAEEANFATEGERARRLSVGVGATLADRAAASNAPTEHSSPASALGSPTVPGDPLRNYIFGPVPLITATGAANVGVGEAVLRSLTTGAANTAVGDQALWQQSTGWNCVAVGALAMFQSNACYDCVAVGNGALQEVRDGVGATAVGRLACNQLLSALGNTGIGDSALRSMSTGVGNTAVGYRAAEGNLEGTGNVVVGAQACVGSSSGGHNVVVGFHAASQVTAGINETVAVGSFALDGAVGDQNVAVGASSGRQLASGNGNVFIGALSGYGPSQAPTVSNSIAIGSRTVTTADNQVVIGNEFTETFVLGGITITREQLTRLLELVTRRTPA